jgi:hypothetical protein
VIERLGGKTKRREIGFGQRISIGHDGNLLRLPQTLRRVLPAANHTERYLQICPICPICLSKELHHAHDVRD